ncbi:50S ribosomal protein L18 [Neochlamydia sp. EPS4]|jgi:large subunit ribosomal protein L18|uniref:50S ribosomal protein L18 n=1 Tax=unclassified Neochlamydia TaxID=2643326 RepID=UPI00057FCC82|nr:MULTISPECIES: 50S ribosomal protein L18 [unclassified Neochlamydia]KIC72760.1 50S ribosomal protein L18 [Neochlamydia sp. EPS4]KIC76796.1 50S ribosomal protein L18 [Neochlamydia sp. TUME1]MBS4165554.1 50S ribosomal protein L18 [Neochlamydia sp. AcF65]NGY94435.1 50S ribosomal protein L18 [Neochlamydia sp. AcF84]BBI17290.1 50S ribosomal protein L18 [Neochlamydia sp. S13]
MINITKKRHKLRIKRALRVRKKIHGTSEKPRLCVVKTNKHIQVQLIDDDNHVTIGSAATFSNEFKNTEFARKNKLSAAKLGEKIAQIAQKNNIKEIVFDRGPFKYHGILAALAEAARSAGLQF